MDNTFWKTQKKVQQNLYTPVCTFVHNHTEYEAWTQVWDYVRDPVEQLVQVNIRRQVRIACTTNPNVPKTGHA